MSQTREPDHVRHTDGRGDSVGLMVKLRQKGPRGIRAGIRHRWRVQRLRHTPWAVGRLGARLGSLVTPRRRLVAVWNGKVWPYAIGNLLELQVATQIACIEHGVERVDLCYVIEPKTVDPAEISQPDDPSSSPANQVTAEQARYYLPAIIQTTAMNPMAGSISVFQTMDDCEASLVRLGRGAKLWPARRFAVDPASDPIAHVRGLLADFARAEGSVPHLSTPPLLAQWARSMLSSELGSRIPIAIGFRNNPGHDPRRNSDVEAWLALLETAPRRFPVGFVIVCAVSEVDPRFRQLDNVVVAKDHATSLEQDMALVAGSAAFMGVSSGLKDVAVFGRRPYSILRFPVDDLERRLPDAVHLDDGSLRHGFASATQRLLPHVEAPELLLAELERLLVAIEAAPADEQHGDRADKNPLAAGQALILR